MELMQEKLSKYPWFHREDIIDTCVYRIPHAYPIMETGIENHVLAIEQYLGEFSNLHVSGRSGRFVYSHIHDMMRFGLDIIKTFKNNS